MSPVKSLIYSVILWYGSTSPIRTSSYIQIRLLRELLIFEIGITGRG